MHIGPLPAPFGAEITDLRMESLTDAAVRHLIRDTLFENSVVVIRDQQLGVPGLVQLARFFGEPKLGAEKAFQHPTEPYVLVLSYDDADEEPGVTPEQLWHSDGSFEEVPSMTTLLAAIELPAEGGETGFANTRAAFESMPADLLAQVRTARVAYSYALALTNTETSALERRLGEELAPMTHPLVRKHPVTGHGSLFLDQSRAAGLVGRSEPDSRELLDRVFAHVLAAQHCYFHQWSVGDLVLWDNTSVMHKRGPHRRGRRVLHRTTTAGTRPMPLYDDEPAWPSSAAVRTATG
jgi:taurine dioxygenase